jgi:hypothetical protein
LKTISPRKKAAIDRKKIAAFFVFLGFYFVFINFYIETFAEVFIKDSRFADFAD